MDQKGFIFTGDVVLGLILVFIILATISVQANNSKNLASPEPLMTTAQDLMESMANYENKPGAGSIFEQMVTVLEKEDLNENSQQKAGLIAAEFINQTHPGLKYNLTEVNHLKGITLSANDFMSEANNINSAQRNFKGYCFQLYIWY